MRYAIFGRYEVLNPFGGLPITIFLWSRLPPRFHVCLGKAPKLNGTGLGVGHSMRGTGFES
ncbi:hypothetical protein KEJ19_00585 [Candidatus Bathyarchaeota archaeon]|nr:hypothetical protein [Candidatus Bathyarchaeota archaeon]